MVSPDASARRPTLASVGVWAVALAVATLFLVPLRAQTDKALDVLTLLLIVLLAAALGSARVGAAIAVVSALVLDWFFLPPHGSLAIATSIDGFVLAGFLAAGFGASYLFQRIQRESTEARERARELTELSALGEEAMRTPRAGPALIAVTDTLSRTLQVAVCRLHFVPDGSASPAGAPFETITSSDPEMAPGVADQIRAVIERDAGLATLADGTTRVMPHGPRNLVAALGRNDAVRMIFPLRARSAAIGALEIFDRRGVPITPARERLLASLTYYAALGVDRLRLERASARDDALRDGDRLGNAVLASVPDELRAPLATIKSLARDLAVLGDGRVGMIEHEASRLDRHIADILDLSRLRSGTLPLALDAVQAGDVVSEALEQVEAASLSRRFIVQTPPEDHALAGRLDKAQTVRILGNLLHAAHESAPDESPIELGIHRRGQWLEIAVSDRGTGVPPHELDRVFESLAPPRADQSSARSAGLSLAVARGLAEAQGGSLTYAPRLGGGSVFTLRLPAVDQVGQSESGVPSAAH